MVSGNNRGIVTIRDVTRAAAVAMERRGKDVSAGTNSRNNRRASVPGAYKKDKEHLLSQLSFETPHSQDMSFGAETMN
jgi:hypothetical protein